MAGALIGLIAAPFVIPHLRLPPRPPTPVERAIGRELGAAALARSDVALFYGARNDAPLWTQGRTIRPQAAQLIERLSQAGRDGLDPSAYGPQALEAAVRAAAGGQPQALAHAEILLSQAFAAYVSDLRRPPSASGWAFADPALILPRQRPLAILQAAAGAPSLAAALADAERMSPAYLALRQALAALPAGGDGRMRALLRLNLERARLLPPDLGQRYILVNPAAQTLWLFEGGRVRLEMPVVVGKPSEPTPNLAGLIRYAVLKPYWNVPPDLVRYTIAPRVLGEGPAYLARLHYEVLSDWSAGATVTPPQAVDWSAVASGQQILRVRQLPGPDNMMGQLKLMLPNPLGVYLHDTPNKALFGQDRRTDSAGCVRLADAGALAAALFGRSLDPGAATGPEEPVDLPSPVPVYIVYLTAMAGPGGVTRLPDIYARDQRIQPLAAPTTSATPRTAR